MYTHLKKRVDRKVICIWEIKMEDIYITMRLRMLHT